ncbi:hypothetical protein NKH19_31715 [Mesorhizobium sp. M1338]|uniref:hypothetical protein n=1 Tax=Mesorhizobium sp. M1338 TaxID=2957085 RepID=UPI00333D3B34
MIGVKAVAVEIPRMETRRAKRAFRLSSAWINRIIMMRLIDNVHLSFDPPEARIVLPLEQNLAQLLLKGKRICGQHVRCDIIDQDQYSQPLGQCFIGDTDIALRW